MLEDLKFPISVSSLNVCADCDNAEYDCDKVFAVGDVVAAVEDGIIARLLDIALFVSTAAAFMLHVAEFPANDNVSIFVICDVSTLVTAGEGECAVAIS